MNIIAGLSEYILQTQHNTKYFEDSMGGGLNNPSTISHTGVPRSGGTQSGGVEPPTSGHPLPPLGTSVCDIVGVSIVHT